jgi:NAD(P)-dependent dehydrogenase (short-subunit alcohol dehydrogenase family)
MKLKAKVAVVAGGASGMGEAVSRLFSAEGATVVVADIDPHAGQSVVNAMLVEVPGAAAVYRQVDVSQEQSVDELATFVAEQYGAADILVNTFGVAKFTPVLEMKVDDWDWDCSINLKGVFLTCRALGRQMVERRRGKIVNFGSTASLSGVPGMVHYTASKHGVLGLTRALAVEWGKYDIHVNCVCPGATTTPMMLNATDEKWRRERTRRIPLQRLGSPESQARVALFLASEDSDYLTGAALPTDGGVSAMAAATSDDALAGE